MNTMLRYTPGQQTPAFQNCISVIITRMCCNMQNNAMVVAIAGRHIYRAARCVLLTWQHEMKKIQQGQEQIFLREFLTNSDKDEPF